MQPAANDPDPMLSEAAKGATSNAIPARQPSSTNQTSTTELEASPTATPRIEPSARQSDLDAASEPDPDATLAAEHRAEHAILELYALFVELDRNQLAWYRVAPTVRARLQHASRAVAEARDHQAQPAALVATLGALLGALGDHPPRSTRRAKWRRFRARALPAYEDVAVELRARSIEVPSVRPRNYARNAFHFASALSCLLLVELSSAEFLIATAWLGASMAWSLELLRRTNGHLNRLLMRLFAPFAHPQEETRVNSATWFATALALISLGRSKTASAMAIVALGVGDPIAALVGKKWGRIRFSNGRSLEGSAAFVVASTLVGALVLTTLHGLPIASALMVAGAASLLGATAEAMSSQVDDNLSIPLTGWLGTVVATKMLR